MTAPSPATEPAPTDVVRPSRWRRLLRPHARRIDLLVAVPLLVLGFGIAVQVRSTQEDGLLTNARQEDLVQILDQLNNRSDRLRAEINSLTATQERITTGSDAAGAALAEARRRTQLLGVLAGTVSASGPGVLVQIADPGARVSASVLLDALEELRDAGAEAMQLEGIGKSGGVTAVRVVASTYLVDSPEGIAVDGVPLVAPYRFVVVGDAATLAGALAIPGGVEDVVRQQGGSTVVTRSDSVQVRALRALTTPRYARPAPS